MGHGDDCAFAIFMARFLRFFADFVLGFGRYARTTETIASNIFGGFGFFIVSASYR
jgi:hypothetical protein